MLGMVAGLVQYEAAFPRPQVDEVDLRRASLLRRDTHRVPAQVGRDGAVAEAAEVLGQGRHILDLHGEVVAAPECELPVDGLVEVQPFAPGVERGERGLAFEHHIGGAVDEVDDADAAGSGFCLVVTDGDATAGGVAVGLLPIDVVRRALVGPEEVDLGPTLGIGLDELVGHGIASGGCLGLSEDGRGYRGERDCGQCQSTHRGPPFT